MVAASAQPGEMTYALCFYGSLPRFMSQISTTCTSLGAEIKRLREQVLPLLRDRVLRPSAASASSFTRVAVYGHTWNPANCANLTSTLKSLLEEGLGGGVGEWSLTVPALTATGPIPSPHIQNINITHPFFPLISPTTRLHGLQSIEQSLSLLPRDATHPVLLLRWDVLFFSPFDLTALNYSLFYRANWCQATKAPRATPSACVPLEDFNASGCASGEGVPDFWFAGTATNMRLVFVDALRDLAERRYAPERCAPLHGILAGRLAAVSRWHGLPLGRVLYQNFDFAFVRSPSWDPVKRVWSIAENHVLHGQAAAAHLWAVSNSHWTEVEIPRENHSSQIERSKLDTAAIGSNMLWHRLWQEGAEPGAHVFTKPQMASVCQGGPRYCGCPAHDDPLRTAPHSWGEFCPGLE